MCPLQRTSGPYSGVSLLMPIGEVANSAREMATTRNFTGVFISVVAYFSEHHTDIGDASISAPPFGSAYFCWPSVALALAMRFFSMR